MSSFHTLLSLISVFLVIRSKEIHPFLSVFSWAFSFLFTVNGILAACSKLAKLLSKTFASEIRNMTAVWFSLVLSSNYNIFSRFCSLDILASITVSICIYGLIYVFKCFKQASSVSACFQDYEEQAGSC